MKGMKNILNSLESTFIPQQIQIIQFIPTEKMKKKQEKYNQQRINDEKKRLEKKMKEIKKEMIEEKEIIEQWTSMKLKRLLFDTDICNWKQWSSTFDTHVFGKDKLLLLIEDNENNRFGCYLDHSINHYYINRNGKWKGSKLHSSHAFIFSLSSNERLEEPTRFSIKQQNEKKGKMSDSFK